MGIPTKWTVETRANFVDELQDGRSIRAACRNVGVSASSYYRLRARDADFVTDIDDVLAETLHLREPGGLTGVY